MSERVLYTPPPASSATGIAPWPPAVTPNPQKPQLTPLLAVNRAFLEQAPGKVPPDYTGYLTVTTPTGSVDLYCQGGFITTMDNEGRPIRLGVTGIVTTYTPPSLDPDVTPKEEPW